jgi:hypothetical protein
MPPDFMARMIAARESPECLFTHSDHDGALSNLKVGVPFA